MTVRDDLFESIANVPADHRPAPTWRRWLILGLQGAVSATLLAILFLMVDWREGVAALFRFPPAAILEAVAVLTVTQIVGAWRLQLALRACKVEIGFGTSLRLSWMGLFANNILPSTVGGDVVIAMALGQARFALGSCVTGLIAVRVINLAAVVACAPVILWVPALHPALARLVPAAPALWLLALGVAGAILGITLLHYTRVWSRVRRVVNSLWRALITCRFSQLVVVFALSVIMLLLATGVFVALAQPIQPPTDYLTLFAIILLSILCQTLPISFNGIGIPESLVSFCLIQTGWSASNAVALSLLVRLMMILVSLPGLPLVLARFRARNRAGRPETVTPLSGTPSP